MDFGWTEIFLASSIIRKTPNLRQLRSSRKEEQQIGNLSKVTG